MKRIDRFILSSFIGPFLAILFVVMFVLMMQFLWLYIDELIGKGLSMGVILEFLMWGGCTIIPMAMPLATLLSSMMTMGLMAEHNELIALKSAGISVLRVMKPIIYASAVITILAFFANNNLVPHAYNKIYTLRDDILKTKEEIKIPPGTFYDGIEGYVLRVDESDEKTGMMRGIMVYDHTRGRGNSATILADSATLTMSKDKDYLTFTLYNGTNYQEDNTMKYRDTSLQLQRVKFAREELIISLQNYAFEKSDSARFSDQIMAMDIAQLRVEKDSLRKVGEHTHEMQLTRLMNSGILAKNNQLDTAFTNRGFSNYSHPDYLKWDSPSDEIESLHTASENANQMVSLVTSFSRDSNEYLFYLRRADLEFLRKFAVALACFIMFFIGAPIGARVRKGGLGVPAIISVLFFVLYYIVDITGSKLAKDGAVAAAVGAFISFVVLIPIGFLLTRQAVNDSSISSSESLKLRIRRLWRQFIGMIRKPRIVYMGTPEFAVAPLERLLSNKKYKVVGVVTVADKPGGRGLGVSESAVKKYAVSKGLPVLQPVKLKDPEFLASLKAMKADIFVVVAFRMLPEEVWSMPRLGTFNLHAALLPQYRGAAPINWAVINGEALTGVTTFMIDKDIDTGGIILREDYHIGPAENVGSVHDALMSMGADLVERTVEGIVEGTAEIRVQKSYIQGSEVLHAAPKLRKELFHIDWADTSRHIFNLIRGLSPYPGAYTELTDGASASVQLKVFEASVMQYDGPEKPGELISDGKSLLAVRTLDGAVKLESVQMAGKKRMEAKAFLAGFRNPASFHCTPGTSREEIARVRALENA